MFDASKDKTLAEKTVMDTGETRLVVAVKQYNGGQIKVSIDRTIKTKGGAWKFAKLRRLAADEVLPVCEGLTWASTTLAGRRSRARLSAQPDPPDPGAPLDTAELVEGLEQSGLSVHVIDENTDFSKLPPLK